MKADLQVQQDISAELKWDPSIDAADIRVEVKDGIVALAGRVSNYSQKLAVERAAQRVAGVKALAIEIDVSLPEASKRSDADIAHAARNVMEWMTYPPKDSVKISVEKGWVTLSGEVDWEYQRRAAKNGVRRLIGVTGVSDLIAIKPQTSIESLKSDIEAAIKRRAQADVQMIHVEVVGDRVVLSGTAHSWNERNFAEHSAWSAPGVRTVLNDISVTN